MKPRDRENVERLGILAAWMITAAFAVSFLHGVRWPFPRSPARTPASPVRQALDPGSAGAGRIEVLNATDRAGLARAAMERLREAGFDVVYVGNAEGPDADSSVVLDRVGDLRSAEAVAQRLGIRRVRTEADSSRYVEVTVLLGRDWRSRSP